MAMIRLTTNAPQNNVETALNLFYIRDRETWVQGGGSPPGYPDVRLNALTRTLIRTFLPDTDVPESDMDLSAMMAEWLFDDVDTMEGTLAMLYMAAWAFAELRERLMQYEDAGMVPGEPGHCEACDFWRENDPCCMNENSQWAGMAVKKGNYCGGFEKRAAQDVLGELDVDAERLWELVQADREGRLKIVNRAPEGARCGNCVDFVREEGSARGSCRTQHQTPIARRHLMRKVAQSTRACPAFKPAEGGDGHE